MTYLTEALNRTHNRKDFSCGRDVLDNYFKTQANQDIKRKLSTCFVLNDGAGGKVKAYYTLSVGSIPNDHVPAAFRKKIRKSYKSIPVVLLGRLAVDGHYQGGGVGKVLLIDALKRCYDNTEAIGAFAVVVDPLDEKAESFYEKYGFIKLPDSQKMFMVMGTIGRLFNR